jgi:hypothetical protein
LTPAISKTDSAWSEAAGAAGAAGASAPRVAGVQSVADPTAVAGLFAAMIPGTDAFETYPWFANFIETGLDPDDQARFDIVTAAEGPPCLFPVRSRPDRFGPFRGRLLSGLSSLYSCRFAPPGLETLAPEAAAAAAAGWVKSVRARNDRPTRILFDALDDRSQALAALDRALRESGYRVERFPHFGTWYLPVAGLDMAAYWRERPAVLRNTVRRKERAMHRAYRVDLEILTDVERADRAIAAYEQVHQASWKPPEPYPAFMAGLIRTGLAAGIVRLGLLWLDGKPAAAQLWLVASRRATIFKLSYDAHCQSVSPGSILTRHMMAEALDAGGFDEIDFGRGDDAYKRDWLPLRRQRWGLAAYDPRRPIGLAQAMRNLGPQVVRRLRGRPPDAPAAQGQH